MASRLQAEYEKHGGRRCVFELWRVRNDVLRLPRPHQHGDVLLAVDRICDRRSVDPGADVEAPQLLQRLGIVRREGAIDIADEHQISGGCERTRIVGISELECSPELAGGRVDRLEAAIEAFLDLRATAAEALPRLYGAALVNEVLLLDGLDVVAAFDGRNIEQAELRIVGGRLPVLTAGVGGAELLPLWFGAG